jgi:uncharacterized phage protein (TIGR01671 family)
MRTIKFRAWDKVKKKMYSPNGYYHYENNERAKDFYDECIHLWLDGSISYTRYEGHCSNCKEDVDQGKENIILMQFTGLLDKNRKEIYEGDIVASSEGNFEVFWYEAHNGFWVRDLYNHLVSECYCKIGIPLLVEVVGNIYENPKECKK